MKCLVFQHVAHEHPGLIAEYAKEKGIDLDVIELWKPYVIPDAAAYDALIIMGGPMGVYEEYLSKKDEEEFIKKHIGTLPMIGFCLGSQLIAHCLGARVFKNYKNGKRAKEIGFFGIDLTPEGKKDPLFSGFSSPVTVLEWHGDAFDMPPGATLLASSPLCANQAFRYKNAYGTLFHFEFTPQMIQRQMEIDKEWMHEENELDEQQLSVAAVAQEALMRRQCYQLLGNFFNLEK